MKKTLLSLVTLALAASSSMAEVATVSFTGDQDLYGLTRQTFNAAFAMTAVERVPEVKFTAGDIDFNFTRGEGSGASSGYALVTQTNVANNTGLFISGAVGANGMAPAFTIQVPDGNISKVVIVAYGNYVSVSQPFSVNGKEIEPKTVNNLKETTWTGTDATIGNIVEVTHGLMYQSVYIQKIEVTYTLDAGGKAENKLAFSTKEAQVVMNESGVYDLPTLDNPLNLPLTWESSNPAVATVDANGKVNVLAGGETRISAAFAGNDDVQKGSVYYDLSVVGLANDIPAMFAQATKVGEKVRVNFPMTVQFFYGGSAWVTDPAGNGAKLSTGGVAAGDIIPAGWTATLTTPSTMSTEAIWTGAPAASGKTKVEYPVVNKITTADAYKVVTLENATFPRALNIGTGEETPRVTVTANGESYDFQNTFDALALAIPACTCKVTCVVNYFKVNNTTYFYMNPIAFEIPFPEKFDVKATNGKVEVNQTYDEDLECVMLMVTGTCPDDEVELEFNLPDGWLGLAGKQQAMGGMLKANPSIWVNSEDFKEENEEGVEIYGKTLKIATDQAIMGQYYLYSYEDTKAVTTVVGQDADGDDITETTYVPYVLMDTANPIVVMFNVEKGEVEEPGLPTVFPEEIDVTSTDLKNFSAINDIDEDFEMPRVLVQGSTSADTFTLNFNLPEGWDGVIAYGMGYGIMKKAAAPNWQSVEETIQNYGEDPTFMGKSVTLETGKNMAFMCNLYSGDQVDVDNMFLLFVVTEKDTETGVEAIEAAEAGARYFNLQGAEVVNPEAGVYVKVLNGKATKVIIK